LTNILIVAHVISRTTDELEEMIVRLGPALQITPQCWTVQSNQAPNAVLRAIIPLIGSRDKAFVVDCATNRASWHNMGPEPEAQLRKQWGEGQADLAPANGQIASPSAQASPGFGNRGKAANSNPRAPRQQFGHKH